MLHEARLALGLLLGNAEGLREEREQHVMAVEHRRSIGVALFGKRDVAVVRPFSFRDVTALLTDALDTPSFVAMSTERTDASVVPPNMTMASR